MNSTQTKPSFSKPIQGLRGFAVLIVFIFHIYRAGVNDGIFDFYSTQPFIVKLLNMGEHGVDLFFIISGFLITGSLLHKKSVWTFLKNRCQRIYPVFLPLHLLIFIVGPFIDYKWLKGISFIDWVKEFTLNIFFVPGVFNTPIAQVVAWSLSYEVVFYLLTAGFYYSLKQEDIFKRFLFVVPLLLSSLFLYYHPRALFFIVGVMIFFSAKQNKQNLLSSSLLSSIVSVISLILTLYFVRTHLVLSVMMGYIFFKNLLKEDDVVSRFLSLNVMQYLGKISYSFYLLHTLVMFPFKGAYKKLNLDNNLTNLLVFSFVTFALSLVTSHYSQKYLETLWKKNSSTKGSDKITVC